MAGCRGRLVRRSGLDRAVLSDGDPAVLVVAAVVGVSTGIGLSVPGGADPSASGSFARVEQPRRPPLPPRAAPAPTPRRWRSRGCRPTGRCATTSRWMPGWIGCVPWSRPPWPPPTNTAARAGPGQDWQRWVARRCDGAVEDVVAIVAAEAPRTSDEVNVQVSGTLRTSCARTDPRPGQAAPGDEALAATLVVDRGTDGLWRVSSRLF